MAVDLGLLAATTSTSPMADILVDIRPYESFRDELLSSAYAWMQERMKTVKDKAAEIRRDIRMR